MNSVAMCFVGLVVIALICLVFRDLSMARMEILRKEKELEAINSLMKRLSSGEMAKTMVENK